MNTSVQASAVLKPVEVIRAPERNSFEADQSRFLNRIYAKHHLVSGYLRVFYERQSRSHGHTIANQRLTQASDRLVYDTYQTAALDEDTLCDIARIRANQGERIYQSAAKNGDFSAIHKALSSFCDACGVRFPLNISDKDTPDSLSAKIISTANRLSCSRWWRRQLRKTTSRQVESVLRGLGAVSSGKAPYVSEYTYKRWLQSQNRNKQTIESMEAVGNVNGEEFILPLADCIESSIANPVNRRNELMVRMRGYEEVATGMGFSGLFLTLTAPSKYHAISHGRGANNKFNGATPRETIEYLNGVWARIRAEWARAGVRCFGFRVAEPHHDGTPHYHFMLFLESPLVSKALEIFGRHALAEDGDEAGAKERRWDSKLIDPEKGTAAGYLAKYVAKNIDGANIDLDEESGCAASDGALRARAWASTWGVRQFQQIGSVSVTVYRELRRRCEAFDLPDADIEQIREAADRGDWAAFVELMGGPLVKRKDQLLTPNYEDTTTENIYCEPVKRIVGLVLNAVGRAMARREIQTRDCVWQLRRREPLHDQGEAQPPPLDL